MHVTEKGQVTIPKHIRTAAGVLPGSEVEFSYADGKITISKVGSGIKDDRRARLKAAAAKVQAGMSPALRQMSATEIIQFLRPFDAALHTRFKEPPAAAKAAGKR